jgi:hypothetical protein
MKARATGLVLLLLLTALAFGVLGIEEAFGRRQQERADEFERLVGGVGFGPATHLAGCAFGFDPRLDGRCAADYGPIPGGACVSHGRACSVFYYPPLAPPARAQP